MERTNGISHELAAFRAKATLGQHYMTILLGTWLLLGIFVDGYAHRHDVLETFFTPWHAILYSFVWRRFPVRNRIYSRSERNYGSKAMGQRGRSTSASIGLGGEREFRGDCGASGIRVVRLPQL